MKIHGLTLWVLGIASLAASGVWGVASLVYDGLDEEKQVWSATCKPVGDIVVIDGGGFTHDVDCGANGKVTLTSSRYVLYASVLKKDFACQRTRTVRSTKEETSCKVIGLNS